MYITHDITVDFLRPRKTVLHVVQDDSTHRLNLTLLSGNAAYDVTSDASGETITGQVAFRKADGHGGVYDVLPAPEYSAQATYSIGDYVVYDGVTYHCTTAIATPEEWTAAHWTVGGDPAIKAVSGPTNGYIVYLIGQCFTCAGMAQINVQFLSVETGKLLHTFSIDVDVQEAAMSATESTDYTRLESIADLRQAVAALNDDVDGLDNRIDTLEQSDLVQEQEIADLNADVTELRDELTSEETIDGEALSWAFGTISVDGTVTYSGSTNPTNTIFNYQSSPLEIQGGTTLRYIGDVENDENVPYFVLVCQYSNSAGVATTDKQYFLRRDYLLDTSGDLHNVTLQSETKYVRFVFGHTQASGVITYLSEQNKFAVTFPGGSRLEKIEGELAGEQTARQNADNSILSVVESVANVVRFPLSFTFSPKKIIDSHGDIAFSTTYGSTVDAIPVFGGTKIGYTGPSSGGGGDYIAILVAYDPDGSMLLRQQIQDGTPVIVPASAVSVRFSFGHASTSGIAWDASFADAFDVSWELPIVSTYEKRDVPENPGVRNALMNYAELTEISYKNSDATIPYNTYDSARYVAANAEMRGLLYSSSRPENGFVPNFVSLETYLSAVASPRSYLHTVDLMTEYEGQSNGHAFYGAVCSSSIAYALNLFGLEPTVNWSGIDGMELLPVQDVAWLKLGDIICTTGSGHVVLVTDIYRNDRGAITRITISEAAAPYVKTTVYTLDGLRAAYPASSWKYYRYDYIDRVLHTQSPFVAVEDETPQTYTLNTAIVPKKGDKCNYRTDESVALDCYGNGWSGVEILKDGEAYSAETFAETVTLGQLSAGRYEARLTGSGDPSEWCEWIVVAATETVTDAAETKTVTVTFTPATSQSKPIMVMWVYPATSTKPRAFLHCTKISDTDATAGEADSAYASGTFGIRVGYETAFGVIFSPIEEINVT